MAAAVHHGTQQRLRWGAQNGKSSGRRSKGFLRWPSAQTTEMR